MRIIPKELSGELAIQPSKSYVHRMAIMAGLSGKEVTIYNVNKSRDILATLAALEAMGVAEHEWQDNQVVISKGDGVIKGVIDCDESGSTLRFLIGVALGLGKRVTFTGNGRLMERPQGVYEQLCKERGFEFSVDKDRLTVCGSLVADRYKLIGNVSSQFISGLLMGLSITEGKSVVEIGGEMESVGYIDITINVMKKFGVNISREENIIELWGGIEPPLEAVCEGDWSHGANYAVMGAICGGITISGLDKNSLQRDKAVINILKDMGAIIEEREGKLVFGGGGLHGVHIDGANIPDIIPVLCVALSLCEGSHVVSNIGRLRFKESDRIESTCSFINGLGGKAHAKADSILIEGVPTFRGGRVSSFNDHRIAMAIAVASCRCSGIIELDDGECVLKSAPDFWNEFTSLGGILEDMNV